MLRRIGCFLLILGLVDCNGDAIEPHEPPGSVFAASGGEPDPESCGDVDEDLLALFTSDLVSCACRNSIDGWVCSDVPCENVPGEICDACQHQPQTFCDPLLGFACSGLVTIPKPPSGCPLRFAAEDEDAVTCSGQWPMRCTTDSQCPNGTHCSAELGLTCTVECRLDDECDEGESCDCSGRCVAPSTGDKPEQRAVLSLLPEHVVFDYEELAESGADDLKMQVRVSLSQKVDASVTVTAGVGVEIACPSEGMEDNYTPVTAPFVFFPDYWVQECKVDFTASGKATRKFWVRPWSKVRAGMTSAIRLAYEGSIDQVAVQFTEPVPTPEIDGSPAWYRGLMRIESARPVDFSDGAAIDAAYGSESSMVREVEVDAYLFDDIHENPDDAFHIAFIDKTRTFGATDRIDLEFPAWTDPNGYVAVLNDVPSIDSANADFGAVHRVLRGGPGFMESTTTEWHNAHEFVPSADFHTLSGRFLLSSRPPITTTRKVGTAYLISFEIYRLGNGSHPALEPLPEYGAGFQIPFAPTIPAPAQNPWVSAAAMMFAPKNLGIFVADGPGVIRDDSGKYPEILNGKTVVPCGDSYMYSLGTRYLTRSVSAVPDLDPVYADTTANALVDTVLLRVSDAGDPWYGEDSDDVANLVKDMYYICIVDDGLDPDPYHCRCGAAERASRTRTDPGDINACPAIEGFGTGTALPDGVTEVAARRYVASSRCAARVATFDAPFFYGLPDDDDDTALQTVNDVSDTYMDRDPELWAEHGDPMLVTSGYPPTTLAKTWLSNEIVDAPSRASFAFPHYTESWASPNASTVAETLYQQCKADLQREAPDSTVAVGPGTTKVEKLQSQIAGFFSSQGCVDKGRMVLEMEWLIEASRLEQRWYHEEFAACGGDEECESSYPTTASKLLLYRLHQWLSTSAFVMRHGAQSDPLERITSMDLRGEDNGLETLEEKLALGLKLFAPLLTDNVASALLGMPSAWIYDPDYRKTVLAVTPSNPRFEQGAVLGHTILEAAGAQMTVLVQYLQQAQGHVYAECRVGETSQLDHVMEIVGQTNRIIGDVEAIANQFMDVGMTNAETDTSASAVVNEYVAAREELRLLRNRAEQLIGQLTRCENPLGIGETNLPLYFIDPQGVSQRFFAMSDYLLHWAEPAIAEAEEALNAARGAWESQRQADIAAIMNEQNVARRIEEEKSAAGLLLIEACGFDMTPLEAYELDASTPGGIDLNTCYRPPVEQFPQCENIAERLLQESSSEFAAAAADGCSSVASVSSRVTQARTRMCMLLREFHQFMNEEPLQVTKVNKHTDACACVDDLNIIRESITHPDCVLIPPNHSPCCDVPPEKLTEEDCGDVTERKEIPNPFFLWRRKLYQGVPEGTDPLSGQTLKPKYADWEPFRDSYESLETKMRAVFAAHPTDVLDLGASEPHMDVSVLRLLDPGKCGDTFKIGEVEFTQQEIASMYEAAKASYGWGGKPGQCKTWKCKAAGNNVETMFEQEHGSYCGAVDLKQPLPGMMLSNDEIGNAVVPPELVAECSRGALGQFEIRLRRAHHELKQAELSYFLNERSYDEQWFECEQQIVDEGQRFDALQSYYRTLGAVDKSAKALKIGGAVATFLMNTKAVFDNKEKADFNNAMISNQASSMISELEAIHPKDRTDEQQKNLDLLQAGLSALSSGNPYVAVVQLAFTLLSSIFGGGGVDVQAAQLAHLNLTNFINSIDEARDCVKAMNDVMVRFPVLLSEARAESLDIADAISQRENYIRSVKQRLEEARQKIQIETQRAEDVPELRHHYWLDERIERYSMELERAKRLLYLALRAVEYEVQASTSLHDDILTADHPQDLVFALHQIQAEQAVRNVNGSRPEERTMVLSLRNDLLKLPWAFDGDIEEGRMTPAEDFAARLMDRNNAVFGADGEYLGQGLRFRVEPDAALDYRCAERLWSVNASIVGDILGVSTPELPLFILKSNTFSSQWCEGHQPKDGPQMQVATLNPSLNMFRDASSGQPGEDEAFSWAFVEAWLNVPRKDFNREVYVDGASEELAGRGLFGDYILLFPWSGLLEEGFDLSTIEDVSLRFDYVSVSNGPALGSPPPEFLDGEDPWSLIPFGLEGETLADHVALTWHNPYFPSLAEIRVIRRMGQPPESAYPAPLIEGEVEPFEGELVYSWHPGEANPESFDDTTAFAGHTWYYRVYAIDEDGGQHAGVDTYWTQPEFVYPATPVCRRMGAGIEVSWTEPPAGLGYSGGYVVKLDAGTSVGGHHWTVLDAEAPSPLLHTPASPSEVRDYFVFAAAGSAVSFDGGVTCTPSAHKQVSGLAATSSTAGVVLEWTNPSSFPSLSGVTVVRTTGATPNSPSDGTSICTTLAGTCTDTTVSYNATYYYWAFVREGSAYHVPVSTNISTASQVTDFSATLGSAIAITWTDPPYLYPSFDVVKVVRTTSATPPVSPSSGTSICTSLPCSDSTVSMGTTYYYWAFIVEDDGTWAPPAMASVTPTNLVQTGLTCVWDQGRLKMMWTDPPVGIAFESGKLVVHSTHTPTSHTDGSTLTPNPITSPSYRPSVDAATTVYYRLFAKLGGTFTPGPSCTWNFVPIVVSGLSASLGATDVLLNWTNPSQGLAGIRIVRKLGSAPSSETDGTVIDLGATTGYSDTTAYATPTATTYYYGVYVLDGGGPPYHIKTQTTATPTMQSVSSFGCTRTGGTVNFTWSNPASGVRFQQVKIVRSSVTFPASHTSGTQVYLGSGTSTSESVAGTQFYRAFTVVNGNFATTGPTCTVGP